MHRDFRLYPLFVLLFLLSLIVSACDSGATPSPQAPAVSATSSSTAGIGVANSTPATAGISPLATATQGSVPVAATTPTIAIATPTPTTPSSLDKIAAAEQSGEIDHDTALLYSLYAAYDLQALPAKYRGYDSRLQPEASAIMTELAERMDQLTPDVRARVARFFLRPEDPASFWANGAAKATTTSGGPALRLAAPGSQRYDYVDAPITNARVWYIAQDGATAKQQALDLAAEIERSHMWGLEKKAMLDREPCTDAAAPAPQNGGDGRLDFYIVPIASGLNAPGREHDFGMAGLTIPERRTDCGWSAYILIARDLDWPHMKSTAAHELFHAFQFAFNLANQRPQDYYWWVEASAVWAEDLVYPDLNFEQNYLVTGEWSSAASGRKLVGPLDRYQDGEFYQFGAYIWPFYLSHRPGGRPEDIGSIWLSAEHALPIDAMRSMTDWEASFKQFALWNLNSGVADKYRDPQAGIASLQQLEQCWTQNCSITTGQHTLKIDLDHAAMQYFKLSPLDDMGFKQLVFNLAGVSQQHGAGVQALITYKNANNPAGDQVVADWTGLTERKFCLDVENVSKIEIVVSNSRIMKNERLQGAMTLDVKEEPCLSNANMEYSANVAYSGDFSTEYESGHTAGAGSEWIGSQWQLGFDHREDDDVYYVITATNHIQVSGAAQGWGTSGETHSTGTVTLDGNGVSHNPAQPGDVQYGGRYTRVRGAGFLYYPAPDSPGELHLYQKDGKYVYEIYFGIAQIYADYNSYDRSDWICHPYGGARREEWYDNRSQLGRVDESMPAGCDEDDDTTHYDSPYTFGALVPYRQNPNPTTGSSAWIGGIYDPQLGVLEGHETVSISNCEEVPLYDPIALNDYLPITSPTSAIGQGGSGSCAMTYNLSWHLELPKAAK